jgi:hypothetical protein
VVLVASVRVGTLVLQCLRLAPEGTTDVQHVTVDQPQKAVLSTGELASHPSDQVKNWLNVSLPASECAQNVDDSVMLLAQLAQLIAQITRNRDHEALYPPHDPDEADTAAGCDAAFRRREHPTSFGASMRSPNPTEPPRRRSM